MGEAKRRKEEIEKLKRTESEWLSSLTHAEQEIARVAMLAHERLVEKRGLVGGCYLLAFFLARYLKQEKSINVDAIVGWVSDGTSPLMASHAWIEFNGRKTDISLTRTEHPDAQLPGPLLIHDRVIRRGKAAYTYHRQRPAEAIAFLSEQKAIAPEEIAANELEHRQMETASGSEDLIKAYLDKGPPDRNYEALARMLSKTH